MCLIILFYICMPYFKTVASIKKVLKLQKSFKQLVDPRHCVNINYDGGMGSTEYYE